MCSRAGSRSRCSPRQLDETKLAGKWEVGLERDVSGTGCQSLGFKPLAECSVDHDIAQIKNDVLFPGIRPEPDKGDMCTPARRPTSLQPTGAKRVQ